MKYSRHVIMSRRIFFTLLKKCGLLSSIWVLAYVDFEILFSSHWSLLPQVAYLDPGNWATAIESGSRFGFEQVWILVLSNLIAILLQTLAVRLGLVTGKHLAQVCRESYPPFICKLLWIMTEVSIVALDLTMVLGALLNAYMKTNEYKYPMYWLGHLANCLFFII